MTQLFQRAVELTIAKPLVGGFFSLPPNARIITGLRVGFQITRTLKPDPNAGSITVYNLSEESRALTQERPLHVKLLAGYGGDPAQIFEGDAHWVTSKLDGADWVTTIELGDGLRAFTSARINKSFGSGTNPRALIGELAATMGLSVPSNIEEASALGAKIGSVSLSGSSSKEMTRIARSHGFEWSIQDGELQMLGDGETVGAAVDVSKATGLIGTPELGAPEKEGGKPELTAKMLLNAQVRPGSLLSVTSRSVNGLFRTTRVVHSGDTHGETWESQIEAVML